MVRCGASTGCRRRRPGRNVRRSRRGSIRPFPRARRRTWRRWSVSVWTQPCGFPEGCRRRRPATRRRDRRQREREIESTWKCPFRDEGSLDDQHAAHADLDSARGTSRGSRSVPASVGAVNVTVSRSFGPEQLGRRKNAVLVRALRHVVGGRGLRRRGEKRLDIGASAERAPSCGPSRTSAWCRGSRA